MERTPVQHHCARPELQGNGLLTSVTSGLHKSKKVMGLPRKRSNRTAQPTGTVWNAQIWEFSIHALNECTSHEVSPNSYISILCHVLPNHHYLQWLHSLASCLSTNSSIFLKLILLALQVALFPGPAWERGYFAGCYWSYTVRLSWQRDRLTQKEYRIAPNFRGTKISWKPLNLWNY